MAEGPKIAEAHIDVVADLSGLRKDLDKVRANLKSLSKSGGGAAGKLTAAFTGFLALVKAIKIAVSAILLPFKLLAKAIQLVIKLVSAILTPIFKALGKIGGAAIKGLLSGFRALKGVIEKGIKATATFGRAMSRVAALTGTHATPAFEKLRETALTLGRTTEFTATQAAEAMGNFAMAGFKTKDILQAIGPTLDFASANMLDLGTASDIAARVMGAMQLSASETRRVMDALTVGATKTNQNVLDLGEGFKNAGSSAANAGATFEMTTAALMAMADQGQRGADAGSALKQVFNKLGNKNVAKLFTRLNIELADAAGNIRDLPDLVDDLNKGMANMGELERLTTLVNAFGERAGPGMSKLLNAGGKALRDYLQLINDNKGAAGTIAGIIRQDLQAAFDSLTSAKEGFLIALGDVFAPQTLKGLKRLAGFINSVTDRLVDWTPALRAFLKFAARNISKFINELGRDIERFINHYDALIRSMFNDLSGWLRNWMNRITGPGGASGIFNWLFGSHLFSSNMVENFLIGVIHLVTRLEEAVKSLVPIMQIVTNAFFDLLHNLPQFIADAAILFNPLTFPNKRANVIAGLQSQLGNMRSIIDMAVLQISSAFARGQNAATASAGGRTSAMRLAAHRASVAAAGAGGGGPATGFFSGLGDAVSRFLRQTHMREDLAGFFASGWQRMTKHLETTVAGAKEIHFAGMSFPQAMNERRALEAMKGIETFGKSVTGLVSGAFKNVKDVFVAGFGGKPAGAGVKTPTPTPSVVGATGTISTAFGTMKVGVTEEVKRLDVLIRLNAQIANNTRAVAIT
tara:strand:+ start:3392 stop:5806 length:2415 start_codon:yes stop_codon:yes gene_type:complete